MMSLTTAQITAHLNTLANLNQASEVGFVHAAEHVRNRGLKIYLKSYAEQRAEFATELRETIVRLGGKVTPSSNPLAVLHRGWIDIIATLTIGRMNQARVVLQEALFGEHVLIHRYKEASQGAYPPAIQAMLNDQLAQIRAANAHLSGIIAYEPNVVLVQLYERADSAQRAVNDLLTAGVDAGSIQVTAVKDMRRHHHNYQRELVSESTVACAIVGALVGILLGLVSAIPLTMGGVAGIEAGGYTIPILIGALIGMGCGMIFGVLIGQANSEDDAYFYETGLRDGSVVISVRATQSPIQRVHQILEMERNKERQEGFAMAGAGAVVGAD